MKFKLTKLYQDFKIFLTMPKVTVNLHLDKVNPENEFYYNITKNFYNEANKRHKKLPLFKTMAHGVALFDMESGFESYFMALESSARRNFKKASRNGFIFLPIDFNKHIHEIWEIRRSAPVRQGELSESFLNTPPLERKDPVSIDQTHDYRYFGIFDSNNVLVAYAGCLIAGQLLMIEHIYGHSSYQSFGVVPMLIISIAQLKETEYKDIQFYSYGTFFGASETMRRFKKKFNFKPHFVKWKL